MSMQKSCTDCSKYYFVTAAVVVTIWLIVALALYILRKKRTKQKMSGDICEMEKISEVTENIIYTTAVFVNSENPKRREPEEATVYSVVAHRNNGVSSESPPSNVDNESSYGNIISNPQTTTDTTDVYAVIRKNN
ncbi:Hypothetical predicted protein [Pelobates cultripes]|uniref:Uncharacterized protein n=1 Tax=Pelobates cultripes TaxID=61616 RepID=A0AAD1VMJ3_PELCU|nr:Hypothetical predicted protein [Pelobates cultripes]